MITNLADTIESPDASLDQKESAKEQLTLVCLNGKRKIYKFYFFINFLFIIILETNKLLYDRLTSWKWKPWSSELYYIIPSKLQIQVKGTKNFNLLIF